MRSAITVCLVPEARSGPFVYHQDIEFACTQASELGFAAIELFPPGPEEIDPRSLRQVLHRNRLDLAAVGSGAGWVARKLSLTSPDCTVRERALQFITGLVDFAGAFGAPVILGSMQGKAEGSVTRDQALHWLTQALEQLGPRAHGYGVPFLLEPLNRYESNLLNTLSDTVDFLQPLRTRNVRILADLFHMNIEEASIPQSIRKAADAIGHVHFADSNRLAMGLGHTDFVSAAAALREIGYKGYLSAEVFPKPSSEEAARQTVESFRRCFPAS
ncbi:MAG: sugar phosphate isomerase/epimerase [Verrucomicrobiales bacterium]|nr:sugar phosphate isomerase/epimerase [Verrucomicrobiales bacterium]